MTEFPRHRIETRHTSIAPTAWGVAYLRTFTDIPYAKEIFDALDRRAQAAGEPSIVTKATRDKLAPQIEARYKLVDRLMAENRSNQILELASGVATRGLSLATDNPEIRYVEMDLTGVVGIKNAITNVAGIEVPPNLTILPGDAPSEVDIAAALSVFSLDQPITVVNEGLMRYLTFPEKGRLADMIYGLLSQFGGVWITPDISLRAALKREDDVAAGHTDKLRITTGIDILKNLFTDEAHAKHYFEMRGFSVESHSFLEVTDQLASPELLGMSEEEVVRLNEPCVAYVMTVR